MGVPLVDHEGESGGTLVVGRDAELALLEHALGPDADQAAVAMVGAPGIGKTTLWDAAARTANARGMRVMAARSNGGEAQLPFAGLIDLCDRIDDDHLANLPTPQRSALEVALLRAEPRGEPVPTTAIAAGLLGAIRSVVAQSPVVIAIDDLQWLDRTSDDLLAFAARRLADVDVRFLLARRPARIGALEQVLTRQRLERIRIAGLSLGAIRRLLFERLGLTVSRQLLRRIVDATEGNPLFALEVGRSLLEAGTAEGAEDLPLPDTVEEMLGVRVARLRAPVRRVLLAVALSADPRIDRVAAVSGLAAVDDAVDAGVVEVERDRVRASHPLLAATAAKLARARDRRELHLALASVAEEEQLQALHLALAATRSDSQLAERLAAAAEDASARGARQQAVLLADHALRLTPAGGPERPERVVTLATRLDDAGELRRLTALLRDELESLPPGPLRARAWFLLSEGAGVSTFEDHDRYLARALEECGEDLNLRALLLASRTSDAAAAAVSGLADAHAWSLQALQDAQDDGTRRDALHGLSWVYALRGQPVDEFCERSQVAVDPSAYVSASPERVAGKRLMWRGELDQARELFTSLQALADERGELVSYAMLRLHLCELETRAGNLEAASLLLDEWAESSDYETQFRPQYPRCRALVAAVRGEAEDAERWATDAIDRARAVGCRWDELEALRARATSALLEQAPDHAVEDLQPVWEHCEREGVLDPGAFPVAPELVEALVELGDLKAARDVTERLGQLAEQQDHPWAIASAKRCRATVSLGSDQHDETAGRLLAEAAGDIARLGLRFDEARCQLVLGRALRRAKRWRAAREALETAVAGFATCGSVGWEDRARAELARVGVRTQGADEGQLTPSERRVVELAAEGLPNKQIASMLYVTVNTVEVHLSHAYAKLGVRSRSQLAKALADRSRARGEPAPAADA